MFTSATRLLQEVSHYTTEDMNLLGQTFVRHTDVFNIMVGGLTVGIGVNQYLISIQLGMLSKDFQGELSSMEGKLSRIEELLSHEKK